MQICPDFDEKKTLCHDTVRVVENVQLAEATFRLRLHAPQLLESFKKSFKPGQFVMLRLADSDDPLLGRPLAVYRTDHDSGMVDVVYIVVGKMTKKLSNLKPGTELTVWGPLGNGFNLPEVDHLVMVAGGIGQTPFFSLAQEAKKRFQSVTLLYGAQTKARLACVDDFVETGINVRIATNDGSEGTAGFVTDLLEDLLKKELLIGPDTKNEQPRPAEGKEAADLEPKRLGISFRFSGHTNKPSNTVIVGCGPEIMLEKVFYLARKFGNYPCQVSLESPMACGLGICFSCVVRCRNDDGTEDYLRTCVDGPVFDAYRLVWKTD